MKRITLLVFGLLTVTLAGASTALACRCNFTVEGSSKFAVSVFIGEVTKVGDPREVKMGPHTEKLYVTRFLVRERWKGPKSIEEEVLTELPVDYGLPQMQVGMVLLVYAFPVYIPSGSSAELITNCSRTRVLSDSAFTDVFTLDKIFRPAAARVTAELWPSRQLTTSCRFCCID
jgi:hypothetical protein